MNYQFEKNKLYAYLGEDLVKSLKKYEVIIAGGAITSLFNNKAINDIDLYFRSDKLACDFLSEYWQDGIYVASLTKKAALFIKGELKVQMIHFRFFTDPKEIFETFDYTVCMGAFDFKTEEFILHNDFLKHNSQRVLRFNSGTAFPIVSLIRVQKYIDKGYTISKSELIRVILACMNLNIDTYEELKEHIGGMYGVNYDKLFEEENDSPFDLQKVIDQIANIHLDDEYFKEPVSLEFKDLDDILDTINKSPVKTITINDDKYRIGHDGYLKISCAAPVQEIKLDTGDFFKNERFYKFVRKRGDGRLTSFWDEDFEYVVGEMATAKGGLTLWSGEGKLYFNEKSAIDESSYYNRDDKVLIEVSIKEEDFIEAEYGTVEAKSCFVLREVPQKEWETYLENINDSTINGEEDQETDEIFI
ncbi:hypothetical protein [Bacillus sp. TYF-LIM-B05]|uniref:hypothetical protein n=1 Tax=Bacillus sp. TYF-LIM-B05 TaxID=2306584 RepID=UPI000F0BAEA1|nr:hypothetical protein [Bacillus sp. TYF-LIM-B05]